MLIIYDKKSGEVLNNQGTIQGYPLGVEDPSMLVASLVTQLGGVPSDYGIFRLHDINDLETVAKTSTHSFKIVNNKIEFGVEIVKPEPEQRPPTEIEILQQENLILQLALAETIEKQEIDKINNQIALAELVETLIIQGVL